VYLLDEVDFRGRLTSWRDAFAQASGGSARVFYAGKAFLCTEVARWLRDEGVGLDVCTGGELEVAVRAGLDMSQVLMHGNNKSKAELTAAVTHGVGAIVVDSFEEIVRLAAVAEAAQVVQPVLVRVTVGVEAHTHEYIATAHEDQKFGFSLTGGHAMEAVRRILRLPALRLLGLHSHIGSQIFTTSGFEIAAHRIGELVAQIAQDLDTTCEIVDLGGGLGIAYTDQDAPQALQLVADRLLEIVRHECEAQGVPLPDVWVEPGRAIAGPPTMTVYEVGTVKPVELDDGSSRRYISVDGGMSDNIRPSLYGADYTCALVSRASDAEDVLSRVVGKHCETGDVVVRSAMLPSDVTAGDLVAVAATGAYGRSMASNYNHVPRPPVVAVSEGAARVIVRRETVDDLLALDLN
jgi:diaminopimelate decarboxylase